MKNNMDEQAFPTVDSYDSLLLPNTGTTLRDYFAAKIAQGYATDEGFVWSKSTAKDTARIAYMFADAMLEERLK